MSFSSNLKKRTDGRKTFIGQVVRKIVIDIGESVAIKSPVGNPELWTSKGAFVSLVTPTGRRKRNPERGKVESNAPAGYVGGRFRASWFYRFNQKPTEVPNNANQSSYPGVSQVVGDIAAGVALAPVAGIHYVGNTLPYGQRLEEGHSTQSPLGMVGLTASEFSDIFARAKR